MYLGYVLVCPVAYIVAGTLKFVVNTIENRTLAHGKTGLGGIPSTHTAIATSAAWLIGLREGIGAPAFAVAISLCIVVVIDAIDLRRKLETVNRILKHSISMNPEVADLRDRIGHTPIQILAGVLVGGAVAAAISALNGYISGF